MEEEALAQQCQLFVPLYYSKGLRSIGWAEVGKQKFISDHIVLLRLQCI